MDIWVWAISGVMWFAAICFTGWGVWTLLFKARRLLRKAELNTFVRWAEESKIFALEQRGKFRDGEPISLFIDKQLKELDDELRTFYEAGGEPGAKGDIDQIRATRQIALAAAFFAIAAIFVGGSTLVITIFGG